jgi:gamma-glutamyltranspeptidase/glutathione hydrolase
MQNTIPKSPFASWRRVATLALTQLLLLSTTPVSSSPTCGAPPDEPRLGAVASESAVCSKIGTTLLQQGGNAVDALVGTVFCIGVVGMYHSGVGGGGFMIVRSKNGSYEQIDFRETAPAAATEDMYNNNTDASLYGGLAR